MVMKKDRPAPVLFLDRDGTVNVDLITEYLSTIEKAKLIPGSGRAIVRARDAGFKVSIITNQAGVAKGLTPKEALPVLHRYFEQLIAAEAGLPEGKFRFDDIRVCMHHPDEKCKCRKPGIQMVEESAKRLNADLSRSFFIGDRETDLACAHAAGVRSILVRTGHGQRTEGLLADIEPVRPLRVVPSLTEAVEFAIALTFGAASDS